MRKKNLISFNQLVYLKGIKMTPYKALFGCEMYSGLEFLNLPLEEKNKIKTAKQLFTLLGKY